MPRWTMIIRPFTETDESMVVELWVEAGLTRPWNDPAKDIRRKSGVQPNLFLVAEEHDVVVGTIMAGYDGHRGWINYLAVRSDSRGLGIARRLMERVEQDLSDLGCPKVQLQVRPENRAVSGFYEHLGYEPYEAINLGKRLHADGEN
jgi:ribosomal protein S18 acetylase RimI-like enzyme